MRKWDEWTCCAVWKGWTDTQKLWDTFFFIAFYSLFPCVRQGVDSWQFRGLNKLLLTDVCLLISWASVWLCQCFRCRFIVWLKWKKFVWHEYGNCDLVLISMIFECSWLSQIRTDGAFEQPFQSVWSDLINLLWHFSEILSDGHFLGWPWAFVRKTKESEA